MKLPWLLVFAAPLLACSPEELATNDAAAAGQPADHSDRPKTYLISVNLSLGSNESVREFNLDTWGVQYEAVCKIPLGWRVEAGASATLEGVLKGEGSHGATWLNRESLTNLQNLVLVTMFAPVQQQDGVDRKGKVIIPATFKGFAIIENGDGARRATLSYQDVSLKPAKACPEAPYS